MYYLRARYMDTSTGRFISQDSYAGSTADPVSLHKYLYANSNPVMYSDPSGYTSLGEVVGCMAISGVICGISSGCINMFRFLWDKDYNGNATNWLEAFSEGYWPGVITGITFGGWAYLATHLVLVGILLALFSGCSAWQFSTSASEKYTNGNTGGAAIDFTLACVSAWSMFYFGYSSFTKVSAWYNRINTPKGSIKGDITKLTPDEKEAVSELVARGKKVEIIPKDLNNKTPDFYVDGVKVELKTLNGNSLNTAVTRVQNGFTQGADSVIIDATKTSMTTDDALVIIERAKGSYPDKTLPGTVEIWTNEGVVTGG